MRDYIGLDVSLEDTHICVVDGSGGVTARTVARTDPDDPAKAIRDLWNSWGRTQLVRL